MTETEQKIDLSKQEAIPSKLTVSTLNQYLYNTADFINKFATFSQNYLMNLEEKLEKLDSQVLLLESKLNSLPNDIFEAPPPQAQPQQPQQQIQQQQSAAAVIQEESQPLPQIVEEEEQKPAEPPEHLLTYIKMLKLKIPLKAVEQKMKMDELDFEELRPFIKID